MSSPDFTSFKALSFDIYGTLIDWETSVISLFEHHIGHGSPPLQAPDIIRIFRDQERSLQLASPTKPYGEIAADASFLTSAELTLLTNQERPSPYPNLTIKDWPAFEDTVEAMRRLAKHYKLIALSNIDHASFEGTLTGPLKDVKFDATYIAEDIGAYKPSQENFQYLIAHAEKDFGVKKEEILMVAHGLETDHAPLKEAGLSKGVWIMRGDEEKLKNYEGLEVGAKFETLREFADAVDAAFLGKGGKEKSRGILPGVDETLVVLEESGVGGS